MSFPFNYNWLGNYLGMLCCALPSLPHCVLTFHQAKWHRDAEGLIDLLRQSALLKPKYLQCFLAGFASAHFFFFFFLQYQFSSCWLALICSLRPAVVLSRRSEVFVFVCLLLSMLELCPWRMGLLYFFISKSFQTNQE